MNLVAVDDGLTVLIRRHEGGEAAEPPGTVLDEDVPQVRRPHLGELLGGLPAERRRFVVLPARLLDQVEARLEIPGAQVRGPDQAQPVRVFRPWMRPLHPVRTNSANREQWQEVLRDECLVAFPVHALDGIGLGAPPLGAWFFCAFHVERWMYDESAIQTSVDIQQLKFMKSGYGCLIQFKLVVRGRMRFEIGYVRTCLGPLNELAISKM